MSAVLIEVNRIFAGMGAGLQALVHSAYVLCGIPEGVVFRSYKNKLAGDVLYRDKVLFLKQSGGFGIVKNVF